MYYTSVLPLNEHGLDAMCKSLNAGQRSRASQWKVKEINNFRTAFILLLSYLFGFEPPVLRLILLS